MQNPDNNEGTQRDTENIFAALINCLDLWNSNLGALDNIYKEVLNKYEVMITATNSKYREQ